jgi:hypothetical protein
VAEIVGVVVCISSVRRIWGAAVVEATPQRVPI